LGPWRVIWRDRRGSEPEAQRNFADDGEKASSPRVSSRGVIAADKFVRRVLAADVDFACAASAGLRLAGSRFFKRNERLVVEGDSLGID